MNRSETINILAKLASPITPFESRDEQIDNWQKTLNVNSLDTLIDIFLNPPTEKEVGGNGYEIYENFDQEIFEAVMIGELIEAMVIVGKIDVKHFFEKIEIILGLRHLRSSVIYMIGLIQNKEGVALLEPLIESEHLLDDEIVNLACAFAGIGGLKSLEILEKMKVKYSDRSSEVLREIEIGITREKNKKDSCKIE